MSGKIVGWAFEQDTGSPVAKLILVKLADNANEDGVCWPSVGLIVRHTGLSERAVRKHLGHLARLGLISVEAEIGSKGQRSNRYQLNVPPPAPRAGGAPHRLQAAPAPRAPTPRHQVQGHKDRTSKEPLLNRSGGEPRAPDGAAVAAALGEPGHTLLARLGPAQLAAWFEGARIEAGPPTRLVATTEMKANWIRNKFGRHLDVALPGGWEVVAAAATSANNPVNLRTCPTQRAS
jgi:DNA-binding transcriptional ArsR family regulator